MPPRQTQRLVPPQKPRPQSRIAAHRKGGGPDARAAHATCNEPLLLARYGQNDPAIALTRKNALFAGSDGGGGHWAVLASLIETCKLNGIDPQGYITDVIIRIVQGHPNSRLDELLPWAYAPPIRAVA